MNTKQQSYISAAELARRYGVTSPTIHKWKESGKIPAPIYESRSLTLWSADTIARFELECRDVELFKSQREERARRYEEIAAEIESLLAKIEYKECE